MKNGFHFSSAWVEVFACKAPSPSGANRVHVASHKIFSISVGAQTIFPGSCFYVFLVPFVFPLGPPARTLLAFLFLGEGFPTKIDYRQKVGNSQYSPE